MDDMGVGAMEREVSKGGKGYEEAVNHHSSLPARVLSHLDNCRARGDETHRYTGTGYQCYSSGAANWKNGPHSHPVEQIVTVLSGTVYAGLGESHDPNKLRMFPAGSVYTEPINTPHYTETREEGAILQATGIGPFGTQYVNPADDPRKK